MTSPSEILGSRICVLQHPDEIVVCANIAGFKSLTSWMAWLAESKPEEFYHFHLLWHLESEASRFDGVYPRNVWFLRSPSDHKVTVAPPHDAEAVAFDLTFKVLPEASLDELAIGQEDGIIPKKYRKSEASYVADSG